LAAEPHWHIPPWAVGKVLHGLLLSIPLAAMNEAFPCGWRRVILVGGM
jgi:hypothetical protein